MSGSTKLVPQGPVLLWRQEWQRQITSPRQMCPDVLGTELRPGATWGPAAISENFFILMNNFLRRTATPPTSRVKDEFLWKPRHGINGKVRGSRGWRGARLWPWALTTGLAELCLHVRLQLPAVSETQRWSVASAPWCFGSPDCCILGEQGQMGRHSGQWVPPSSTNTSTLSILKQPRGSFLLDHSMAQARGTQQRKTSKTHHVARKAQSKDLFLLLNLSLTKSWAQLWSKKKRQTIRASCRPPGDLLRAASSPARYPGAVPRDHYRQLVLLSVSLQ